MKPQYAGLRLRIGAMFYDAMLVCSVLFFATIPVLPLTGGIAVATSDWVFSAYLTGVAFLYFGWQWRRGCTLGMKAWRLMIVSIDGKRISWPMAALRFAVSIVSWLALGAGFAWALVDRQGLAWHDRASGTRLIVKRPHPGS